jgi:AcrR family transcriptional regulator
VQCQRIVVYCVSGVCCGAYSVLERRVARKKTSARAGSAAHGPEGGTLDREDQYKRRLDLILKTAARCFNEIGYNGTSLRGLAARLKVTDGALYYYVRSKEELAFLCYTRALALSELAITRAATEGRTGLERVQIYIRYQVDATRGPEGPLASLSEIPTMRFAHRAQILDRIEKNEKMIVNFIQLGIEDGSISECDAVIAAATIRGALNWVHKWFDPNRHDVARISETMVQVLTRGIARS